MNGNAGSLNFIYQNPQMGVETIGQLMDICEDEKFKLYLKEQYNDYESINNATKELLEKHEFDVKGISKFDEIKTYLMINIQTLTNKSSSHISEMLIVGSTMGIIDAIKKQRKYQASEKNILDLMRRLQKVEEKNIENLKRFL